MLVIILVIYNISTYSTFPVCEARLHIAGAGDEAEQVVQAKLHTRTRTRRHAHEHEHTEAAHGVRETAAVSL